MSEASALTDSTLAWRKRGQLEPDLLTRPDETPVLVGHPHFCVEFFIKRNQGEQDRTRLGDRANCVCGQILDHPRAGSPQFEQFPPASLLVQFLDKRVQLSLNLVTLGVKIAPVIRQDLRHLLLGLG